RIGLGEEGAEAFLEVRRVVVTGDDDRDLPPGCGTTWPRSGGEWADHGRGRGLGGRGLRGPCRPEAHGGGEPAGPPHEGPGPAPQDLVEQEPIPRRPPELQGLGEAMLAEGQVLGAERGALLPEHAEPPTVGIILRHATRNFEWWSVYAPPGL